MTAILYNSLSTIARLAIHDAFYDWITTKGESIDYDEFELECTNGQVFILWWSRRAAETQYAPQTFEVMGNSGSGYRFIEA